jgi:Zn-dependent protease with chaperone function
MTIRERILVWLLRRTCCHLLPLDQHVYHTWAIQGLGCSLGPIVILATRFVIEATPEELHAVLAHEEAHRLFHQNYIYEFFLRWLHPQKYSARRYYQEFEADAYAAKLGHAQALASALKSHSRYEEGTFTHPPLSTRLALLETYF